MRKTTYRFISFMCMFVLLSIGIGIVGCGSENTTQNRLESIIIEPTQTEIQVGVSEEFVARGIFEDTSTRLITQEAIWEVSDPNIAKVSNAKGSKGLVTGVGAGSTTLTVEYEDVISLPIEINVSLANLNSLSITPVDSTCPKGTTLQFNATGIFSNGSSLGDITHVVEWTSTNDTIAYFSTQPGNEGLCHALEQGTTTLMAKYREHKAKVTLTVTTATLVEIQVQPTKSKSYSLALGTAMDFSAIGIYSDGTNIQLTTSAVWHSEDSSILDFDKTTPGRALALAKGSTYVWAWFNNVQSTRVQVNVSSAILESIELEPANPILPRGQTLQFTALGHYSDESVQDLTNSAMWTSSNVGVATVSNAPLSSGLAVGLSAGTTTINARVDDLEGARVLTVQGIQIVSLSITPTTYTLPAGETCQYTATATYNDGTQANVTNRVIWRVTNTEIAVVSNVAGERGLVTARKLGNTTLFASIDDIATNQVKIQVTLATLKAIIIDPANTSTLTGTQVQFYAKGEYSDGTYRDITNWVTWSSSNSEVATISNVPGTYGLASAKQIGYTLISAEQKGINSHAARLDVVEATLEYITINPSAATIWEGETVQFSAFGQYSDGNERNITQIVLWQSSNQDVGYVSNSPENKGLVTGMGVGETQIVATYEGVDSSLVGIIVNTFVNIQPVAILTGPSTVIAGEEIVFSARDSYDPDGEIVNYTFGFGDATPIVDNGTNPEIPHIFQSPNIYIVTLMVCDDQGALASTLIKVTVTSSSEPPNAVLVCPSSGEVGEVLEFDASSSFDVDGEIVNYIFNFDDGEQTEGIEPVVSHSFANEGVYIVTLTVKDDQGLENSTECVVAIGVSIEPQVSLIQPQGTLSVVHGQTIKVLVDAQGQCGYNITRVVLIAAGIEQGEDLTAPYEFEYIVPSNVPPGATIVLYAKAYDNAEPSHIGQSTPAWLEIINNDPPSADFTAVVSGENKVTVDASTCFDSETPTADLEVRWDWENNGVWDTEWNTQKILSYTYPFAGDYMIAMQVRDSTGQIGFTTRVVSFADEQIVSGVITTSTWYGTINVVGSVTVPEGEVLTVSPSTQILINYVDRDEDGVGDIGIYVQGDIQVQGTLEEPVLFTAKDEAYKRPGAWQGIEAYGSVGASFDFVTLEYANRALVIENSSSVTNSTFRFNKECGLHFTRADAAVVQSLLVSLNTGIGIELNATHNISMTDVTCENNDLGGLHMSMSTGVLNNSSITGNTGYGIGMYDSDLAVDGCIVNNNHGIGLLYQGNSNGSLTHSEVSYNDDVGIRVESTMNYNPASVINYNNVFSNSVIGGTISETAFLDNTTLYVGNDDEDKYMSSPIWTVPNNGVARRAYVYFQNSYYATGTLEKGDGTPIYTFNNSFEGWVWIGGEQNLRCGLTNQYEHPHSIDNVMSVTKVEYDVTNAVGIEMSASVNGGQIDAQYNWWGIFPNVLDHVSFNQPEAVNIQGFVGVPYDSSWDTGPYKAGDVGGETWSNVVYVTGDLYVPIGSALNLSAGTQVLFVPIDQNADSIGDYGLYVYGDIQVSGTAKQRVKFASYALPARRIVSAYNTILVDGAVPSVIQYADFSSGNVGLEIRDASLVEYCEFDHHNYIGLLLAGAKNCSVEHVNIYANERGLYLDSVDTSHVTDVTVQGNQQIGVRVKNTNQADFSYLQVMQNIGDGFWANSSQDLILADSIFRDNQGAGLVLSDCVLDITHCETSNNSGEGLRYIGANTSNLDYTNVTYNGLPGIVLLSRKAGDPALIMSNSNLFGNSSVNSLKVLQTNPGYHTLYVGGKNAAGYYHSLIWQVPDNGIAHRVYIRFANPYYASGTLENSIGKPIYTFCANCMDSFEEWKWVREETAFRVGLTNKYTSIYSEENFISATNVEYLINGTDLIELMAATATEEVSASGNYWGMNSIPSDVISENRIGAVDYSNWAVEQVAGCGPRG